MIVRRSTIFACLVLSCLVLTYSMAQEVVCVPEPPVLKTLVSTVPVTLDDPSIGCGGSLPSPCAESPAPTVTLWPDRLVGELKIEAVRGGSTQQ